MSLKLHGSTPCLAWSPDSRHLVVNSAYDPWLDPNALQGAARKSHGLHVLNLTRRQKIKVSDQSAYHPFWLDGNTVAFARSSFGGSDHGLFVAHAGPRARVRRIGPQRSIHNAYPAKNGKLMVFIDGPPGYGWYDMDRHSGKLSKVPESNIPVSDRSLSWAKPLGLIQDQCPQQVGQVRVFADPSLGVGLQIGQQIFSLADEQPWKFDRGMGGNALVQPCLSPDGRMLAYLTTDGAAGMDVKVMAVPGLQLALAESKTESATGLPALEPLHRMTLHGSTPCLAWSPDGRRVLANAAYEYYGYDQDIRRNHGMLGIWMMDRGNGQATRIFGGQGYHPFWLGNNTVGWGHSKYEDGAPGLYLAPARADAPAQRIGTLAGVHRTAASRNGKILVYVGWPEYKRWGLVDPDTAAFTALPALKELSSWSTPDKLVDSQCLQELGDVSLDPHGKFGILLNVAGSRYRLSAQPLFRFKGDYGSGAAKAVEACISPTGDTVAVLVDMGHRGASELRILTIPR